MKKFLYTLIAILGFANLTMAMLLTSSCSKSGSPSKTIVNPGFKMDSSRFCIAPNPSGGNGGFITFDEDSYRPTPNTWYKTSNNIWYKTGSDVNVVEAFASFRVLSTPYTKSCQ